MLHRLCYWQDSLDLADWHSYAAYHGRVAKISRVQSDTADEAFLGFAVSVRRCDYGVPDGAPAITHENARNEEAVKSMAGSTVE